MEEPGQTQLGRERIWNWKDVVLISLAGVLLLLAGAFLLGRLALDALPIGEQDGGLPLLVNAAFAGLEAIALVASVYFLGLRRLKLSWPDIGLRPSRTEWIWAAVLVAPVLIPLVGVIAYLTQITLDLPPGNPQLQLLAPEEFTWIGAVSMILMGGLAVPFAEELFFRGVLYRWLRDRWGVWVGAFASSIVFGLLHGFVAVLGATFVMGLILAWFYERSQSLWPPVIIHAIFNSAELILLYTTLAAGFTIPGVS